MFFSKASIEGKLIIHISGGHMREQVVQGLSMKMPLESTGRSTQTANPALHRLRPSSEF